MVNTVTTVATVVTVATVATVASIIAVNTINAVNTVNTVIRNFSNYTSFTNWTCLSLNFFCEPFSNAVFLACTFSLATQQTHGQVFPPAIFWFVKLLAILVIQVLQVFFWTFPQRLFPLPPKRLTARVNSQLGNTCSSTKLLIKEIIFFPDTETFHFHPKEKVQNSNIQNVS